MDPSPTTESLDLSIVVASYETRELLASCLESLRHAGDDLTLEVIVVDNRSGDGSPEMVARDFPEVRLIQNARNEGFARANNRALATARGRYVLLLNPDTEVPPGTLGTMAAFLDAHPRVGVAGPRLERPDGGLDFACKRGFPTASTALSRLLGLDRLFPRHRVFGDYRQTFVDPCARAEVDSVVGAFMMVRRSALAEVGGLDEDYFMFGEDLDWCWRLKRRGHRVFYLGDVRALHHKNASVRRAPHHMNWHFHWSMVLFHRKHLVERYPFFVNWAIYLAIAALYGWKSLVVLVRGLARRGEFGEDRALRGL